VVQIGASHSQSIFFLYVNVCVALARALESSEK
jgi:hypothetical protein